MENLGRIIPGKIVVMNYENYFDELAYKENVLISKQKNAVSYPEDGNEKDFQIEENSFWFTHRNNCIIEAVKKYSHDNLFFDIGGGNGFVAEGLEKNGTPTILIEPGQSGCLNAKKRGLKNIICSTFESAHLKENTISAIGLFDVVEHIEQDGDFLKSINKSLKEKGIVFITVPAYTALWSNEDIDVGHFRRYSLKEIEDKLRTAGFNIEYSTYLFYILPIAIFLFRTIPSKLGLNKNSYGIDKRKKEHKGIANTLLNWIWNIELNKIIKGEKITFGSSCFVVARKK